MTSRATRQGHVVPERALQSFLQEGVGHGLAFEDEGTGWSLAFGTSISWPGRDHCVFPQEADHRNAAARWA